MTATLMTNGRKQFVSAVGSPLAGGFLYYYVPATTTFKTTWKDSGQTLQNTNPIILDAAGTALVYGSGTYREYVTDALGNLIQDALTSWQGSSATSVSSIAALRLLSGTPASSVFVLGYATIADGGEGEFIYNAADTTSADNGGTIIIDASGNRWYRSTQREPVSVAWFGSFGTGIDETTQINAALTYALANKRGLFFPGTSSYYSVSSVLTLSAPIEVFGTYGLSTIKTTSATAGIFSLTGSNISIHDLNFDSTTTQTAAQYINLPNAIGNIKIERCFFANHLKAIALNNASLSIVDISNCYFFNAISTSGVGIYIAGGFDLAVRHCIMNSGASPEPFAGIQIVNSGDIVIDDCNIIAHTNDLLINPGNGQVVASVYASNTFFDTSDGYGLLVDPTGTGSVVRCRFIGCWFSSHGIDGVRVTAGGGSATVTGIEFVDCHAFSNASNGFNLTYGSGFTLIGCQASGNTAGSGLVVAAGISGVTATCCTFGPCGGFGGNTDGIFVFTGGGDHLIFVNNQLQGNSTSALANGATGAHQITSPNLTA